MILGYTILTLIFVVPSLIAKKFLSNTKHEQWATNNHPLIKPVSFLIGYGCLSVYNVLSYIKSGPYSIALVALVELIYLVFAVYFVVKKNIKIGFNMLNIWFYFSLFRDLLQFYIVYSVAKSIAYIIYYYISVAFHLIIILYIARLLSQAKLCYPDLNKRLKVNSKTQNNI
jgi:hypothetical protein